VTDANQQSSLAPGIQAQGTGAWEPASIMVAPNGARRTKQDHPALPMNAAETARCAAACHAAGAAMIHVHVRDYIAKPPPRSVARSGKGW
jgi:uncharacterized protein (DUF849 family)